MKASVVGENKVLRVLLIVIAAVLFFSCSTPDVASIPVIEPEFTVKRNFTSLVPEFDGLLVDPRECAFDDEGNLYVLDVVTCQILIIDNDLQVVDVYAGVGNGPGEFHPGSKIMAIGADRIIVYGRPTVHVFTTDGLFIRRFPINDPVQDIDIGPDGTIIATVISEDVQLVGWNQDGNEIYRRGRPFLALPMTREMAHDRYRRANETCVEALDNGNIAVLGTAWTRVRFYIGEEYSEHLIDLRPLPVEEGYEDIYNTIMEDRRSHSLERATTRLRRGTLTPEDLPFYGRPYSPVFSTHDGNSFWIANQGILSRVNGEGTIDKACVFGRAVPGMLKGFAVSGTMVALCFSEPFQGNGIAIGEMRFTEPE